MKIQNKVTLVKDIVLVGTFLFYVKLLVAISMFFVFNEYSVPVLINDSVTTDNTIYSAVVRLYNQQSESVCSGFVVSDSKAITAAHCVIDFLNIFPDDGLFVSDIQYRNTVKAKVVFYDKMSDIAILFGNFTLFGKLTVADNYMVSEDDFILACGFPYGLEFFCSNFSFVKDFLRFKVLQNGRVFSGMSGGPVFVINNNKAFVIGVNGSNVQFYEHRYFLMGDLKFVIDKIR